MKSLSLKISVSILFAVLLIFSAIILYNYTISRDLLLKNVESNVLNLAESKALRIDKLLETTSTIPRSLSYVLEFGNYTENDLREFLHEVVEENAEVFGSCIAFEPYAFDPDSIYYAPYSYTTDDGNAFKYLNSPSLDYFNQDWYRQAIENHGGIWTEPYFDEGGGDVLMCTYSYPFYTDRSRNDIHGVVTVDISLKWLEEFVESIKVYENGYAFLISSKGTIISDPNNNSIKLESVFNIAEQRGNKALLDAANAMIKGERNFIPFKSDLIDGKAWMCYTPIEISNWSLAIIIPETAIMADLHTLNYDLLMIGIIGFVLLLFIVVFIAGRITRPLTRLAAVAKDIGKGNFDAYLPERRSADEIGQLNASIRQMQHELKHYVIDLQETTAAKEKIESELQIARDIQQGIIPKLFPPFPNIDSIDLYAVLDPARDVGGDLYDFFFVDDKHLCITIGDVSGKGVPASLFMAITRTLLRAKMNKDTELETVVSEMNNELCLENDNAMFVTFFLGIIDIESGRMRYTNAGHNYPIKLGADGKAEEIKGTHGTPLGAMPDLIYSSSECQLNSDDMVFLYTDGVSEAIDKEEIQYTEDRLMQTLEKQHKLDPEKLTSAVIKDLHNFVGDAEQFDDITILAVRWFDLGDKTHA